MIYSSLNVPSITPRAKNHHVSAKTVQHSVFRDNFSITTWLALGALLQCAAVLTLPLRVAVLPAICIISYRLTLTILRQKGVLPNLQMDGVVRGKFSASLPPKIGSEGLSSHGEEGLTVLLLAARSNHAMGLFGPGYKNVADYINKMLSQLTDDAARYGFLGQTSWINAGERLTNNQVMVLCYFRSLEDLHAYAHGPLHSESWRWWNEITQQWPHLSIMHEVYHAPKSHENIFINNHLTGIANLESFTAIEKKPAGNLVDASRGRMRTQMGRMGKGDGSENDGLEERSDPNDHERKHS